MGLGGGLLEWFGLFHSPPLLRLLLSFGGFEVLVADANLNLFHDGLVTTRRQLDRPSEWDVEEDDSTVSLPSFPSLSPPSPSLSPPPFFPLSFLPSLHLLSSLPLSFPYSPTLLLLLTIYHISNRWF